jgi:hypothetical protein
LPKPDRFAEWKKVERKITESRGRVENFYGKSFISFLDRFGMEMMRHEGYDYR